MHETLSGVIERVTFHNPENGFAVLRVAVPGRNEPVTVIGHLTMVTAGESLDASGRWVSDPAHGLQFRADQIKTTAPTTPEGIEKFLASGAVRSVGPKLAARIVALYRDRTLKILDEYPEMLVHLKGVGPERLRRIRESWREQRHVRRIMLFLHAHGIGSARATRIYRTYGEQSVELIRENPYRLADDIHGIGFRTADELARKLGLDPTSPHRVRAAVRYTLSQLTTQGHVGCPQSEVIAATDRLVDVGHAALTSAIQHELTEERLVREEADGEPWLFLTPLHRAEVGLAESVKRLQGGVRNAECGVRDDRKSGGQRAEGGEPESGSAIPHSALRIPPSGDFRSCPPLAGIDVDSAITWAQKKLAIGLSDGQREAIRLACSNPLLVITGGPGVGKTTLVRSLLEIAEAKKLRCVLAAPTGRAARRLTETTGRPASTIHRLLGFDPVRGVKHGRHDPLTGDLFVLDEVSMVDVVLGNRFLQAVPPGASVILVGDVDQLPSVGPGTVLRDLITSGVVPTARLSQIFRQAESSRIVTAAYAVHAGKLPPLDAPPDVLTDFYFAEADTPEAIRSLVLRLARERIPQRFGLDPLRDVQVLTPMNRSALGARALNEALQPTLNSPAKSAEITRFGTTFRLGDRVIQTENNYQRGVFNGDLGTVTAIDPVEQELTVRFDEGEVSYDFGTLDELSLAYALTIHKSQGSEYPAVIIPVHTQHFMMLQRNLLYTGITRGKKLVVLVGSRQALELAVTRQDTARRYTRLRERLV